ncbi:PREDICTED: A-kinase anchor protein 6-like, partial [Fulmarus glacialis]|uniref:A-kinase anchor protein 6-like n=1 Tax=Fulmarus glacialis TaxID=30455 RepID=UPI00051B1116
APKLAPRRSLRPTGACSGPQRASAVRRGDTRQAAGACCLGVSKHQREVADIKTQGFVSKLDEFIHWLNEAMETTENWTPPKAETDSLKLYLETHLSFKLNVDSHCALKEAVVEEGRQLLELIVSHKSGLKDMLQMIASQWKELQRQIKRQHSWILRALDIIKAEILATDVSAENEEGTGSPK